MLLTVVFGSVSLVNAIIDLFEPGYTSYYRGPMPVEPNRELWLRDELRKVHPDATDAELREMAIQQIEAEHELNIQRDRYYRIRRLIQASILILVAFPTYRYHWRRAGADEQPAGPGVPT